MWYRSVFTLFIYYCDLFCSGTASCIRYLHRYGWVRYIDTTKITVLRFVWDSSVSYYHDFFCSGPALRLRNRHRHVWVRYIDTTTTTVACMLLLLLSIDLRRLCYFIMFYFKLTNGAMVIWWMVKWCNGEIKNRTGHFFSHKYQICSFVLFLNTTFLQQKKQSMIFNFWSLTTSTATKFIWNYLARLTSFSDVQEWIIICELKKFILEVEH